MSETPQQNRYARAKEASAAEIGRSQPTAGHGVLFAANHRLLLEHGPDDGPDPLCTAADCGEPWPCGIAESAMAQVGVRM